MDFYEHEYQQFQWDVHILIEGTLEASIRDLNARAKTDLAQIETALDKATDAEYAQHLVDEHVDVLATGSNQERFLRNMALVALASRLTHALRSMARSAESFSARKKRYGNSSMSEFDRIWEEYRDRFGIDFVRNAHRIGFVDTMREVRNQIVHDGSEANTLKPLDFIDVYGGDGGLLDLSFSKKYPEYVSGEGMAAEVNVSQEQLQANIDASVELIGWLAEELRKKELLSIRKS
jgi:hypothetical protein